MKTVICALGLLLVICVYSSFALDCFRCTGYSDDDECSSGGPELINSGESDIKKTCTDSDDVCFVTSVGDLKTRGCMDEDACKNLPLTWCCDFNNCNSGATLRISALLLSLAVFVCYYMY